jgi:hypothetical protein
MIQFASALRRVIVVGVSLLSRWLSTVMSSYRRRKLTVAEPPDTAIRGSMISTRIWLACRNSFSMAPCCAPPRLGHSRFSASRLRLSSAAS